ncbi:MAG: hypothetical protein L0Y80_06100 [Ignavibacteriae bacterium]|nr:hypothetical protein [Ignavibacteriota bacterium]
MELEQQSLSPFWAFAVKYGFVLIVVIFYITTTMHFDYTPDDTYIYMQYAKNIARGDGFTFNAGMPSYGVTSPLWTLLVAAGTGMGLDPYVVAKTLDLVFACIAVALVYVLTYFVVRDKRYAVIGAALFSFDVWFLRWAGTGMETSLAVVLTLLSFLYVYRNEYQLAALAAGVLTLVRPEGSLLFIALQVDNFLNTKEFKPALRSFFLSSGMYALVVVPWVVFSAVYFGTIVPNTLASKSSLGMWWESVVLNLQTIGQVVGTSHVLCLAALVIGLFVYWRVEGWKLVRLDFLGILWIVLLPLAYLVMSVQIISRYLLIVSPFIVIYGLWGIKKLEESGNLAERRAIGALVVLTALTLGINQYVYRAYVVPHMEQFTTGMNDVLKPIAYWLHENTEPDAKVLITDVGMVGYISERKMFDTAGLISPEVGRILHEVTFDAGMLQHLYRAVVEPDYILDRSTTPERLQSETLQPVMTKLFPSLGVMRLEPVYFTLYKVVR